MQRKFLKIILIVFVISLFLLNVKIMATEDVVGGGEDDQATTTRNSEDTTSHDESSNNTTNTSHESDIGSTGSSSVRNVTSSTYVPPQTSQPSSSYSTITPIPEANLTLNNILNAILIAIGIVLILFAIAILIRLK